MQRNVEQSTIGKSVQRDNNTLELEIISKCSDLKNAQFNTKGIIDKLIKLYGKDMVELMINNGKIL